MAKELEVVLYLSTYGQPNPYRELLGYRMAGAYVHVS